MSNKWTTISNISFIPDVFEFRIIMGCFSKKSCSEIRQLALIIYINFTCVVQKMDNSCPKIRPGKVLLTIFKGGFKC